MRNTGNRDSQPPKVYRAPGTKPEAREAQKDTSQPQPRPQAPKSRGKRSKKISQKQMMIIGGGVTALLLVVILLAALLPGLQQKEPVSSIASGSSAPESLVTESGYDKNANALPTDQLQSTILQETEDAGAEYVEETLFLGDSNTVRMLSYRDVTNVSLSNGIGVEGMGIQAFNSLKCVQFKGSSAIVTMPDAVAAMQPRRIVITFGTNNVGGMNLKSFIAEYEKAIDTLKEKYQFADIIIGAIPPIDQYHMNENITMTTVDKFNVALAELAEQKDVKFVNWTEVLKDSSTGFCKKEYTIQDGIHLSRAGMEAMFGYFRTHSFIGEDRRPKPLKTIPERVGYNPNIINNDPTKRDGPPSSSSSSSSQQGQANVVFSVWNSKDSNQSGGSVSVNGTSGTSVTVPVNLGAACPTAVATPAEGYRFLYWTCSIGSIGDTGNATLSGFQVFSSVKAGETVTVTAVFEPIPVASSSSVPPSSVPPSSVPPAPPASSSIAPPVETPSSTPPVEQPAVQDPAPPQDQPAKGEAVVPAPSSPE